MNINLVKEDIKNKIGHKVIVKIYGMRNKVDTIEGYITHIYPNIFMVENQFESKSISYSDLITKEAIIKFL